MQKWNYDRIDCGEFGPLIDQTSSFEIMEDAEVVFYSGCFSDADQQIIKIVRGHAKIGMIQEICHFPDNQLSAVEIRKPTPREIITWENCDCTQYFDPDT
jgi:hypothetical protein